MLFEWRNMQRDGGGKQRHHQRQEQEVANQMLRRTLDRLADVRFRREVQVDAAALADEQNERSRGRQQDQDAQNCQRDEVDMH